jgi:nucleotide-binding universal stress UspA family protein
MNVLFATDFYTSSTTARALLMRLAWSAEARLELLHVLTAPPRPSLFAARVAPRQQALEAAARELHAFAMELEKRVEESLGSVHHTIRVGDPAGVILEHAAATRADLVVIGGPGRTESASGEMSPLSAAVIDRAQCSVLVARSASAEKLALAIDGAVADEAAAWVARWHPFRYIPMEVIALADASEPHRAIAGIRGSVLIARPEVPLVGERPALDQTWSLGRG